MQLIPCDSLSSEALHAVFASAFSDYLAGPFELTPEKWKVFVARHGTDPSLSRAVLVDGVPAAFVLVNPRMDAQAWRVSGMGATPAARGTGAAQALLDDCLARAREAGAESVELECFQKNERALRLYRSRGFEVVHAREGYAREADAPALSFESDARVNEIAVEDAFARLDALSLRLRDLPYQVTGRSLRASPPDGVRAWACGDAALCTSVAAQGGLVVQSLIDPDPVQAAAQVLVAKLVADHPATKIFVPQLQRRDLGGTALERLGFG